MTEDEERRMELLKIWGCIFILFILAFILLYNANALS